MGDGNTAVIAGAGEDGETARAVGPSQESETFDPATMVMLEEMNEVGQQMIESLDRIHLLMGEIKTDLRAARDPRSGAKSTTAEAGTEDSGEDA